MSVVGTILDEQVTGTTTRLQYQGKGQQEQQQWAASPSRVFVRNTNKNGKCRKHSTAADAAVDIRSQ